MRTQLRQSTSHRALTGDMGPKYRVRPPLPSDIQTMTADGTDASPNLMTIIFTSGWVTSLVGQQDRRWALIKTGGAGKSTLLQQMPQLGLSFRGTPQ